MFQLRLSLLALIAVVALAPNGAQAKPPSGKLFGDWGVVCGDTAAKVTKCYVAQTQTDKSGGQLLMTSVGYIGPKDALALEAQLPLGIYLPAGALLKIGDVAPITMVIQSCTIQGCSAAAVLSDAALKVLEDEKKPVTISIKATGGNQTGVMTVSLKGFKAAFDALKQ